MQKLLIATTASLLIVVCTLMNANEISTASAPPASTGQPPGKPIVSATSPVTCLVTTNVEHGQLNLRSGPSIEYPVVAILGEGSLLVTSASVNGWLKVSTSAGQSGWINSNYCGGSK
jgi:uncharacterized protein YgiM (DUF1202 family)